ncbi:MAG: PVC-type heme-binding CxxCH protein [Verrucomicrobiota bacterium]
MSIVFRAFFRALLVVAVVASLARAAEQAPKLELKDGDRVVFLGDTLIEQEQYHGWIELMLTARSAGQNVTFRNLGWSADTPAGDSRFGLSLLQAGREPANEGWANLVKQIEEAKPTVVFLGYGMASSFDGDSGLTKFKTDYRRLLDIVEKSAPGVRLVFLSPIAHEAKGAPWVNPAPHNNQLAAYTRAVGELAGERKGTFVSLYDATKARPAQSAPLTLNGIHPTQSGYRALAEIIEDRLFGSAGAWRASGQVEPLRRAILTKNEWFFHRSRPANMAYIFGFRKREQGKNATEVLQFDEFIAAEEKRIAQLRALQPANVPEIPRRVGNRDAKFTPQPHPEFQVADGLEITLWAENPLLNKPLQMNFDPKGRLWVVSSELYPQIEPGQAATDKIIVLEDTTGAGRADKATVFADGLLIPTGIEVGDGGAYVAQSTDVLHFKDNDGDGKADVRRVVLSGFGTEDTHHNLHTLRWAPDGRLTMSQSVYTRTDTETPQGVVRLKAGGTFRFDPRDEKMEILYRGLINGWGHQFDAYGQSMMTDGAGFQGVSWGVPGATMLTLAPARRMIDSISPGRYPKFASIELVHSTLFPADWQGDAITLDFRAHRVVRFKIMEQGSGYVTKEMPDLLRTTADSFRPIDIRLGPDGALYIADWSNPIIQHGEVDFRDPRRDKAHGRIWRVAAKGGTAPKRVDLTTLANADLLGRLLSPNSYEQEQSRRVLVERGAEKVMPDLEAWAKRQTTELAKLRALWMYQAFNRVPAALLNDMLAAKDARVRAAAVRVLPATDEIGPLERLVVDTHPRVRLAAVRALGARGSARSAELALGVLERPMDPYLDYALWLTMNELAEPWLAAVKSGEWNITGREKQLEFALKAVEPAQASAVLGLLVGKQGGVPRDGAGPWIELIGAAGGAAELRLLFDQLQRGELAEAVALRAFTALADAARLRSVKPSGDLAGLASLLNAPAEKTRVAALQLAGAWKVGALIPQIVAATTKAGATAAERAAAFAALRDIGGAGAIAQLKKLASEGTSPDIQRDAAVTLAGLELPTALPYVVAVLKATTDEAQSQALWRSLLSIRGVSARLATELEKTEVPREVARAGLRPAREGTQHQALVPVLLKAAGLSLSNVQMSPAELQQLAQEALAKGDARRGEFIYRRAELACVACHAIGGAGGKLGPDLTSLGASAPADYIVESLLYPSAKIKEGYHSASIATRDGQEQSGMITKETATEIVLRTAANQDISIPTKDIVRRTSVGSLMPAGLLDTLVPEERLDLIKFIAQLGKPGDYDAAKGGVGRAWKLYLILSTNEHLGVERVVAGDFSLKDWNPVFSLTSGTLPKEAVEAQYPNRGNNRGLFAGTRAESTKDGTANFTLSGVENVKGVWVNGTLVKPAAKFSAKVKRGTNTIVVQLNDVTPADMALRSGDVTFAVE